MTIPPAADRWTLIRDVAVLQIKLLADGLRDLILVPASLIAGLLSLASGNDGRPGDHFYRLLSRGKQTERWINLFGALDNAPADVAAAAHPGNADIDQVVARLETFIVDDYRRGGVTAQTRTRIRKILEFMQRNPG